MQLSEAIRLGSLLKPQGFSDRQDSASCALEAAAEAAQSSYEHWTDALFLWPWLVRQAVPACPACEREGRKRRHLCEADDASDVIWQLNDEHKWTREQIADWVATVEPQDVLSERTESPQAVAAEDWKTEEMPSVTMRDV